MRRLLALCFTMLLTLTTWAETITVASWNAGTIDGGAWNAVGTEADKPSLEFTAKYNSNTTSVTTVTFTKSIASGGAWVCALKLEGDFKAGDVITIQPFTQMSNSDFTGNSKYANILLYGSDVKQIADLTGSVGGALTVTDGHEEAGDPKTFSYTLTKDYTELYFGRGGNTRINLMKVIVTRDTTEPQAETVSVFLTAGQSNTAGRCMNENLPDYIKTLGTANNGTYQYCNWSYTNGSTRKSESEGVFRKFWPEMESANNSGRFAYDAIVYYWLEQALQKDFYVVKHAMGGTSIDPSCLSSEDYHWSADATWLKEHASCNTEGGTSMLLALCSNIGKSIDALTAAGKSADIKAMIWHQGESDRSGTGPDNYHDNLQAVVKYVRDYLVEKTGYSKYATLDFICGTVPKESKQYNKKVYDALFTLAQEDSHFHVIETSPGTFIGDQLHFDTNCAERLGIGMYNKMVDLGLVSGEKQDVPAVVYPQGQPITLDFKTWATENVGSNTTYQNLILSSEGMTTLDGETTVYKAIGCEAEADFSEFAETFAIANTENKVRMRGSVGLQLTSGNVTTFSILNLEPGDGVTITFGSGSPDVTTLATLSENIFVYGDEDQTVLTKGTALTSGTVTYVVKSGTQIDLTFGSTGGHYINKIVIEPDKVEIEEEAGTPVVHMCGDSMMSIYGDQSSDESANATYTQGMRGWGQFFQDYFTTESGIIVQDWAHTGTTAKGFYSGANFWPVVMGNNTMTDAYKLERPYVKDFVPVKAGDYVILCWGHNDQKGGSLHNGYKTITESEYITYLTTMVNEVKAKGAYPILATSICRSLWNGKNLTRLGMIDACEAAGETHTDSNDPYNYPEAMRNLAAELGVPCIDLNAASKELWEDFGPGLTASVFFEGVGTTHTAEKGARAMGIAANHTILSWDTTDEKYANYATLKAAMKTDVEQYDKDDYATAETTVATETVWTFEKSADGQTTYTNGDVITNELLDYNGLYLRGYNSTNHEFKAQAVTGSFTFSNNKQVSWSMGAIASAMSITPCSDASTAGQAVTTSTDRCIALNTSGPGTLYVAMRTKGDPTGGRYFKMAFNGTEVDSKASSKSVTELKYHAEEAGVFYAWGTEGYIVVAVYYVPDADSSEDDMHEKTSIKTTIGSHGYSSFSSDQALDFSGVEGLKAYVVKELNGDGLAVFKRVSTAPAETGLILSGTPGEEYDIPVTTDAEAPESNLLVATVEETIVAASTDDVHNYMFANGSGGLGFYRIVSDATSKAGKAYLCTGAAALASNASGSRSFVFEDDVTTGISDAARLNKEIINNNYFDLQGRKVAQPTRGLYIVNGKKVVIK